MLRAPSQRILPFFAFLLTAFAGLNLPCAAHADDLIVTVAPRGRNAYGRPVDPTPAVFVQAGDTKNIKYKAEFPSNGNTNQESKASQDDTWEVIDVGTKAAQTYDQPYYSFAITPQQSADHTYTFADTPDFKIDRLSGKDLMASINFTPKKTGYWYVTVKFTAVVTDKTATPAVKTYVGSGTGFVVAAQATIAAPATNVIVGQQLALSTTISPRDIDTASKKDYSSKDNKSTTFNWTVPNTPLTDWQTKVGVPDPLNPNDPMAKQTYNSSSTPIALKDTEKKMSTVTFFWYKGGSVSGTQQTVNVTITDPAWNGLTLTPKQDFVLYQPKIQFTATPVPRPTVQPYIDRMSGAPYNKVSLGRNDKRGPYGIVFTRQSDDSPITEALGTLHGTFTWCQTIQTFDVQASNPLVHLSGPKTEALDSPPGGTQMPIWSYTNDDVAVDAPATAAIDGYTSISVNEMFTMHIMYTPPPFPQGNALVFAVPMQLLHWKWSAKFAFANSWIDQGSSNDPNFPKPSEDALSYPTWQDWVGLYSQTWQ